MVISLVHYDAFTCTFYDTLTCTSRDSVVVHDQSIITPTSSAEENINFTDDVDVASFNEPGKYLTATNFQPIHPESKQSVRTILVFE